MNNKLLERVSMPTIATSLSFDSLMEISQESPRDLVIIGEDSEEGGGSVSSRSRGRSQEWRHDIEGGEEGEGEEEGEGRGAAQEAWQAGSNRKPDDIMKCHNYAFMIFSYFYEAQ